MEKEIENLRKFIIVLIVIVMIIACGVFAYNLFKVGMRMAGKEPGDLMLEIDSLKGIKNKGQAKKENKKEPKQEIKNEVLSENNMVDDENENTVKPGFTEGEYTDPNFRDLEYEEPGFKYIYSLEDCYKYYINNELGGDDIITIDEGRYYGYEFIDLACQFNTYVSLTEKLGKTNDVFEKYCSSPQDSGFPGTTEIESNYKQYIRTNKPELHIEKYEEPINIKIANWVEKISELKDFDLNMKLEDKIKLQNGFNDNIFYYIEPITLENGETLTKYNKISGITIMNGYNTTDENWKNNARAKKIKVTINNDKEFVLELENSIEAQTFDIEYLQDNLDAPMNIDIEVLESYPGEKTDDVYISDIRFGFFSSLSIGY